MIFVLLMMSSFSIPLHISRTSALAQEEPQPSDIVATIQELTDLLNLINIQYIDAVSDGKIINQDQYDEAIFYTDSALETFNNVTNDLHDIAASQTVEVNNDLNKTSTLIQNKADTRQVSDTLEHAKQELQEIFIAAGGTVEPLDGWFYIDSINEILDQLVMNYSKGSYEEARGLAREAYLDDFVLIRSDIAEDNRGLMEKIDSSMRVDLVNMIDNRRPASEIESSVDQIKADLEEAKSIVTPEFPIAALVLTAIMILIVFMSRRRANSIPWG